MARKSQRKQNSQSNALPREIEHPVSRAKKSGSSTWPILAAIGASTLLLGAMEMIFIALSPAIIAATPATPPQLVVPWVRWAIAEHDGIETYVVLPGMLLFLAATAGGTFTLRKTREGIAKGLAVVGAFAAAVIVLRTRSSEFFPVQEFSSGVLLFVFGGLLIWAWRKAHKWSPLVVRRIAIVAGFILFTALVVLSLPQPSMVDYGYFIGPALKLLQGERLGSFYMQYNLIENLLFTAMVAGGLKAHAMEAILALLFAGWYVIYWLIAKRLFQDRFVGLLCMAALVVTRFLAIRDHPVMIPQVLPLRLDLWAPLLLAVMVWGLTSWRTSLIFGAVYALDSTFGFLFAAVYAGSLAIAWWSSSDRRASLRLLLPLLFPAAAAGIFQKLVFGSWISPAAAHYLGVQIGFMPISSTSLFWPTTMLLGWAAAVFMSRRSEQTGRIGLLLCAFAAVQFIYFYGRSHDHNLINLSSVWLLPIFLAVDQAAEIGRARVFVGAALVLGLIVMSTQQILPKFERTKQKIENGVWLEPYVSEKGIDSVRGQFAANTLVADPVDAYLNYRVGLQQRGFYVPFEANVFLNETAGWMDDQIRGGMHIVTTDGRWSKWVEEFSEAPIMKQRGRHFATMPAGAVLEISEQANPH